MASKEQQKAFIERIAPLIVKEAKARGYKIASTVIAQACCESAYGTCALSPYHNYFGMKCGGAWKGKSVNLKTKEEYTVGTLTNISANFRVYDSMEEGVKGYYDFIAWSRYANLKTATTYRQYAEMLKADGYATSSTYVNTLCTIVESQGLAKFDDFSANTPVVTPTEPVKPEEPKIDNKKPSYKIGKTYTTQVNLYVRDNPTTMARKKLMSEVSANAKLHSYADSTGACILKKGTKVTCLGIAMKGKDIWLRIPSGYVAAYYQEAVYVK